MKIITSILTYPAVLLFIFSGACFLYVLCITGSFPADSGESARCTLRGLVYWSVAWGMLCAVVNIVISGLLAVFSFVLTQWGRLIAAAVICVCSVMIWLYFLNMTLPLP